MPFAHLFHTAFVYKTEAGRGRQREAERAERGRERQREAERGRERQRGREGQRGAESGGRT